MIIIPPELIQDKRRYFTDLEYREECDHETYAERAERLTLLFNPHLVGISTPTFHL